MSGPSVGRVALILLWAAVWALVLTLDANLGFASDSPILLAALFLIPQLALGYAAGPLAIPAVAALAVAWAPLANADCVANGAECGSPVLPAIGLAVIWGLAVALGYGLRVLAQAR